jgi:hypothetical protein
MSKILDATCAGGMVTAGGVPVPAAAILSEGVGPSSGVLVMEKDKATYLTSNAADLKETLGKTADALTKIATTLTSIGLGMAGPATAPPPTLAADVAEITATALQLEVLKEMLK